MVKLASSGGTHARGNAFPTFTQQVTPYLDVNMETVELNQHTRGRSIE